MSGGLAWAIVEPSTNSTIECTIDCGCTTTSMRSSGKSNSRCASITSRPLFTRVAELVVTTGPMRQVGWASACSGVTDCEPVPRPAAERAAARGQHQPLAPRSSPRRAGTGRASSARSRPARSARAWPRLVTSGPPMISDSLLASARVRPGVERGERGPRPTAPVTPFSTTSQGQAGELAHRVRAGQHLGEAWRGGASRGRSGKFFFQGRRRQPGLASWSATATTGDAELDAPGGRAGQGCRRLPPAPRRGSAPGCGGRCRAPGCRSTRSSRGSPRHEGLA